MEQKFTLGVGGAVVRDGRLLLVHHTYGSKKWQIPGGYVKPHECAHESVVREVHEETGIHAKIDGLLGVNFLLHFAFSIDYRRSRLILHRMDDFVPAAGTELSYFVVGDRFLVVPGKVDGHSTYLFVHTGMAQVPIAPSQGVLWTLSNGNPDQYKLKSAEFGPVTIQAPVFDSRPFPVGLDTNFGFTIGAALGHEAFRGRILAFDPVRMRMRIE